MPDLRLPGTSESEFAIRKLQGVLANIKWPAAGFSPSEIEKVVDHIEYLFELSTGIEREYFRQGASEFLLSLNPPQADIHA